MKEVILRNDVWLRGIPVDIYLNDSVRKLEGETYQCCLGVLATSLGVPEKVIDCKPTFVDKGKPIVEDARLSWLWKECPNWFKDSAETNQITEINDDLDTDDEYKVTELNKIFNKHGFNLVFEGGANDEQDN